MIFLNRQRYILVLVPGFNGQIVPSDFNGEFSSLEFRDYKGSIMKKIIFLRLPVKEHFAHSGKFDVLRQVHRNTQE